MEGKKKYMMSPYNKYILRQKEEKVTIPHHKDSYYIRWICNIMFYLQPVTSDYRFSLHFPLNVV